MELNVFMKNLELALVQRGVPNELAIRHISNLMQKFTDDDLSEIKYIRSTEEIEELADGIAKILNREQTFQSPMPFALEAQDSSNELNSYFCINCGQKVLNGGKFCTKCGSPVQHNTMTIQHNEENISKRNTIFEGKLHKCPNCGEVLDSFVRNCPSCGMEIRDAEVNSDILNFINQLNSVEQYSSASGGIFKSVKKKSEEEKKINIIRNFPIPNTTEAMLEFMVLATSNINISAYGYDPGHEKPLADAWLSKIEQIYKKANISDGSTTAKRKISDLYDDCKARIKKESRTGKRKSIILPIAIIGGTILLLVLEALIIGFSEDAKRKNWINSQVTALNSLSSEIEQDISNHEYIEAAIKLNGLRYKSMNDEPSAEEADLIAEWTGIRTSFIRKIEMEADETAITIKPPIDPLQAIGQDAYALKMTFEAYGFVYTSSYEINDLLSDSLQLNGTVEKVLINGSEDFTRNSTYLFTDPVSITVHSIQYAQTPDSSDHFKGKDAEIVKEQFISAGFQNIEGVNLKLPENMFSIMNGKVVEVSINGESDFKGEEQFVADAKVVIRYK